MSIRLYRRDLAHVHDVGFSDFALRAVPGVLALLQRHGVRGGRVVEYGCGGGVLARALVGAGYDVIGVDISPAMVRIARSRVPRAEFRVGSLTDADVPRCRAIIAVGEVVSYVREPDRRPRHLTRFFARAFRALEPGGLLLFDFMESARGRAGGGKRSGDGWSVESQSRLDSSGRVLTRRITTTRRVRGGTRRATEVHVVRVYDREAIAAALTACGFQARMRRSYGRARLLPGDVVCVAVKRGQG